MGGVGTVEHGRPLRLDGSGSAWDCHRRAFEHFGGVPATVVYDRTKTWCASTCGATSRCRCTPEAIALPPTTASPSSSPPLSAPSSRAASSARLSIVRHGVLDGRDFSSPQEMDDAFGAWLPVRLAQVHRSHGEVISVRAERNRDALGRPPSGPTWCATATCARWARWLASPRPPPPSPVGPLATYDSVGRVA